MSIKLWHHVSIEKLVISVSLFAQGDSLLIETYLFEVGFVALQIGDRVLLMFFQAILASGRSELKHENYN